MVGVIVYLMMMMLSDQCSTSSSAATELVWFVSISDLAPESVFNVYSSIHDTILRNSKKKKKNPLKQLPFDICEKVRKHFANELFRKRSLLDKIIH